MWIAFGLGVVVGLFSGMFLLGLIRELALSGAKKLQHKNQKQRGPEESDAIPLPVTT